MGCQVEHALPKKSAALWAAGALATIHVTSFFSSPLAESMRGGRLEVVYTARGPRFQRVGHAGATGTTPSMLLHVTPHVHALLVLYASHQTAYNLTWHACLATAAALLC
jgi:hypothetical protein